MHIGEPSHAELLNQTHFLKENGTDCSVTNVIAKQAKQAMKQVSLHSKKSQLRSSVHGYFRQNLVAIPSVSKPNLSHVDIFRFSFVDLRHIL